MAAIPNNANGSSRPRGRRNRCVLGLRWSTLMIGCGITLTLYLRMFVLPGVLAPPDTQLIRGQKVTRRHPDQLYKVIAGPDNSTQKLPTTPFDGVMEGHLTLIDIEIPAAGLHASLDHPDEKLYEGVTATFCHISWDLPHDRPSQYPTFAHLQEASFLCPGTLLTADLGQIARQAAAYDFRNHTFVATQPKERQLPIPPTLVVFHESKSGGTVLSNALAAFAPGHTRVYADAPAVTKALRACGSPSAASEEDDDNHAVHVNPRCDPEAHQKLIQDVFYLLGRVSRPVLPQYVFYKVDAAAAQNIGQFVQAMPHAPWAFAYRDGTEVVMSHFPHYQLRQNVAARHSATPACLDGYGSYSDENSGNGMAIAAVAELVQQRTNRTLDSLTKEEYCAAYVATLGASALRQHERTAHQTGGAAALQPQERNGNVELEHHPLHQLPALHDVAQTPHWLVEYHKDVPHTLWEHILPQLVAAHVLTATEKERIKAAAGTYAHGGDNADNHFHGDSTMKRGRAPPSVQEAVALFLDPVYAQLEAARADLMARQPH